MNITDFTFLLNKPDAINSRQTLALEEIVNEFPYFQSARALYLKGLYNEESFKYNNTLKVTAAHTTDRSVLFDFITSDSFTAIQKGLYDQKLEQLHQIVVSGFEVVIEAPREIPQPIASETAIEETPAEKLELGKPLDFSKDEKHSFQEWLQLSQINPIEREVVAEQFSVEVPSEPDPKQKKSDLIDRFIETNPKISPVKQDAVSSITVEPSKPDNTYLMTETLARVYLEQKKYQKAIQAYQILILKYPEKSSFFADRILDIKNLQQNNNTL